MPRLPGTLGILRSRIAVPPDFGLRDDGSLATLKDYLFVHLEYDLLVYLE